jgi:endonuclease-3
MKKEAVNWPDAIKPLLKKYKNTPHPLEANNVYQYMVLVVLSAQTNDKLVNAIAPELFNAFPNMESLSEATPEALFPYISKIINFRNKAKWITAIAASIKKDSLIPLSMDALVKLPGIGRKSANVILRAAGAPPEGIIVDLHVLRVAPRLGIAQGDDAVKMEKQLMETLPANQWDIGMAISFLGREICRPKPECDKCLMNKVCDYFNNQLGGNVVGK